MSAAAGIVQFWFSSFTQPGWSQRVARNVRPLA